MVVPVQKLLAEKKLKATGQRRGRGITRVGEGRRRATRKKATKKTAQASKAKRKTVRRKKKTTRRN